MQGTRVWSLGQENPLKKRTASHSSILAWEILWTEEPGGLQFMGLQRVRHDWLTALSRGFLIFSERLAFSLGPFSGTFSRKECSNFVPGSATLAFRKQVGKDARGCIIQYTDYFYSYAPFTYFCLVFLRLDYFFKSYLPSNVPYSRGKESLTHETSNLLRRNINRKEYIYINIYMLAQSLRHIWLFVTPWTVVRQAPLSMGFPRHEYWSWVAISFSSRSSQSREDPYIYIYIYVCVCVCVQNHCRWWLQPWN